MPQIKPFRAYRFNPAKVHIADVVAPPYDVISPESQIDLYANSPHNVVRLILNQDTDKYDSAANFLADWKREEVLIRDPVPAFYVLHQQFKTPEGKLHKRIGFMAACRLEEIGKGSILPHEKTHSRPREDRFSLFKSTQSMFSQIFGVYSDPENIIEKFLIEVMQGGAIADFGFEHVETRLYGLRDQSIIANITRFMIEQKVLIADGHHRYETALSYRDYMRRLNPGSTGEEPFNFVPMYLTNMYSSGLIVLPTHRLVHSIPEFNQADLLKKLEERFSIQTNLSREKMVKELRSLKAGAFGLVLPESPRFSVVRRRASEHGAPKTEDGLVHSLDVTVLNREIMESILGMSEADQLARTFLSYDQDEDRAIESVVLGNAQAAFIMNPTSVENVRAAAEVGEVLPQKSTYFSPKLPSGLVNYSFVED